MVDDKEYSEIVFSTLHYAITLLFFFVVLVNIISLTISTFNMSVPSNDTYGNNAKNLMITAQVISYIGLVSILSFAYYAYSVKEQDYLKQDMLMTGASNVYEMMRIVTFSILMFVSIVVSVLCLSASYEIEKSEYSSEYGNQNQLCKELGRMFFLHFILFTSIQGFSYLYQIFYENGTIKTSPGKITSGRDIKKESENKEKQKAELEKKQKEANMRAEKEAKMKSNKTPTAKPAMQSASKAQVQGVAGGDLMTSIINSFFM